MITLPCNPRRVLSLNARTKGPFMSLFVLIWVGRETLRRPIPRLRKPINVGAYS
jgi:hypothetical protein